MTRLQATLALFQRRNGHRATLVAVKVVAQNRRAKFDLDIQETVEAGILLTGQEVKSCRLGQISLAGSYISFYSGVPTLKQAKIAPYKYASDLESYEPGRDRPLLLRKEQMRKLEAMAAEKGIAIVPLEVRAGRFIKLLLGVGKGRKRLDKRQRIREREVGRRLREGREV